jgi:hypothetical protein
MTTRREITEKIMEAAKGLGAYKMGKLTQLVLQDVDHRFATKGKIAKEAAGLLITADPMNYDALLFVLAHLVEHDGSMVELRFKELEDAQRALRQFGRARGVLYHSFEKRRSSDGSRREFRLKIKYGGKGPLFYFQMSQILATEDRVTQYRDKIKGFASELITATLQDEIDMEQIENVCVHMKSLARQLKGELEQSA